MKVVGIVDGDTTDILTDDMTTTRIRLNGIDAPERGQAFSAKSKELLSELVGEKAVRVETHDEDRYGRTIGDVFVKLDRSAASNPDAHVNFVMVANAYAGNYVQYAPDNKKLADAEKQVREKKLGL